MDETAFAKKVSEFSRLIGYDPIGDEPDYKNFFSAHAIDIPYIILSKDPEVSPEDTAKGISELWKGESVALFIPGRKFDTFGTRKGRGGGWYDRFLSKVPREWFRIGVLSETQLSDEKLERKSWDEPMDVLLVWESGTWRIISVF